MNKRLIIFLIIAPLIGILFAGAKIYHDLSIWSYGGQDTEFQVYPGESFGSINFRLGRENLIKSTRLFHRYSQMKGIMTQFKTGKYIIKSESTMLDVIDTLISGKSITVAVTIPEGKNIFEIAKIVEKFGICNKESFIKFAKDAQFVRSLKIPASRVEGYLYPDTYRFTPDTPCNEVIKSMVSLFKRKISSINFSNSKLSIHQIIILSSIVEKETGAAHERPMIAGVFLNRLEKNMRLQSDPTTIYGIYEHFNGNLRKKHLLEKTPYNTYKISGLPKGPICNPGTQAIDAVLNPTKHKFLYFVSQNDGTHVFSENYRKHLEAVNKWQKTSKNRKGKSWRDLKQN